MSTNPTTHVHSDDHPGCRALWPWLPGCSRYRLNVNLVAAATEDVAAMPESDRADWLNLYSKRGKRSRWHIRSNYISHRENWCEDEIGFNLANAQSMAEVLGDKYLKGRTVGQAANDEWRRKVQRLALEVLYVYRAPLPAYDPAKPA